MRYLIKNLFIFLISVISLMLAIDQIKIIDGWVGLLYSVLVLFMLYWLVKPVIGIIFFPINLVTLNLSAWLIDILIFYIWTLISPQVKIGNWHFAGLNKGPISISGYDFAAWQVIIISGILLSIFIKFYKWLFH